MRLWSAPVGKTSWERTLIELTDALREVGHNYIWRRNNRITHWGVSRVRPNIGDRIGSRDCGRVFKVEIDMVIKMRASKTRLKQGSTLNGVCICIQSIGRGQCHWIICSVKCIVEVLSWRRTAGGNVPYVGRWRCDIHCGQVTLLLCGIIYTQYLCSCRCAGTDQEGDSEKQIYLIYTSFSPWTACKTWSPGQGPMHR